MPESDYATSLLNMLGEWEKIETMIQNSIGGQVRLLNGEGEILAGASSLPEFCSLVRSSKLGLERCRQSYAGVCSPTGARENEGGVFRCHAGLSNFFFPITYQGKVLGAIVGGAVFGQESHMSQAGELLREVRLHTQETLAKMKQVPRIPEAELRGVARIMKDVTGSFIEALLQHEHLAQVERQLRAQLYQDSSEFIIDEPTGVFTPAYLLKRLDKEISRARRYQENLSLLVLSIENLRRINHSFGHEMGDLVLREIAAILQRHARQSETVARLSGTCFAVIFPRTNRKTAEKPLQRLKTIITRHSYELKEQVLSIAPLVKMGLAEYNPRIQTARELLLEAQDKLD